MEFSKRLNFWNSVKLAFSMTIMGWGFWKMKNSMKSMFGLDQNLYWGDKIMFSAEMKGKCYCHKSNTSKEIHIVKLRGFRSFIVSGNRRGHAAYHNSKSFIRAYTAYNMRHIICWTYRHSDFKISEKIMEWYKVPYGLKTNSTISTMKHHKNGLRNISLFGIR